MKINQTVATVDTNIDYDQTTNMTVDQENISHIMKMVTEMYQKPYAAIPREYISNAIDSHKKAGQTRPVEVSLPSAFSQNFIVRDYGVGMSRAELTDIYSKYGSSTKNLTNDEIGGFGLGAKSALALVSQFTVKSVQDGLQNVVVIAKDETGVGALNFLEETLTDAPNGVTVTIPMPNVRELTAAIEDENILLGWEKGSIIVDGKEPVNNVNNPDKYTQITDRVWVKNSTLTSTTTPSPYNRSWFSPRTTFTVLVGSVAYSVSAEDAELNFKTVTGIERHSVVSLPIGSVDFTPSRDNFIFTRRTREALHEAFDLVQPAYFEVIKQRFNGMTDATEVFITATAIRTFITNNTGQASNHIPLTWQGEDIPHNLTEWEGDSDRRADVVVSFGKASGVARRSAARSTLSQMSAPDSVTFVHSADTSDESLKTMTSMRLEFRRAFPSDYCEDETSLIIFTSRKEEELTQWDKVFARKVVSAADFLAVAVKTRRERTAILRAQAREKAAQTASLSEQEKIMKVKEGLTLRVVADSNRDTASAITTISAMDTQESDKIVLVRTGKGAENTFGDVLYRSLRDGAYYSPSVFSLILNHFKDENVRIVFLPAAQKSDRIKDLFTNVTTLEEALSEAVETVIADPAMMYLLASSRFQAPYSSRNLWAVQVFAEGNSWDGYTLNEEALARVNNAALVDFIKVAVEDKSNPVVQHLVKAAQRFSKRAQPSLSGDVASPSLDALYSAVKSTEVHSLPLLFATTPPSEGPEREEFITDAIDYINRKVPAL